MDPYPYQKLVAEQILEGKSVILQAPTGAGKTRAALLPFIHAWQQNDSAQFPTKCIYIVPMRVLANQFFNETLQLSESFKRRFNHDLKVTIQTGERPEDKRFEGDLIFCTIDQFLSSYLTMPYSQPYRLANINAGVMVGAYIVLDEFHLLDPTATLPSTMYAIKRLSKVAPVLLMTATFSAEMLTGLANDIGATPILISPDEAHVINTRGNQPERKRFWHTSDQPLNANAVITNHKHRTLAICNTVRRARELYRAIKNSPDLPKDTCVRLLHSQFLQEDRKKTENELCEVFGKDADRNIGSYIIVATQTIEVGVDISAEKLHTELAPASALIQRAGRCARYPGEHSTVWVHPIEDYRPYSENKEGERLLADQMQAAWGWLKQHDGEIFDFAKEQELVNAVASKRDRRVLDNLDWGSETHKDKIYKTLGGEREGMSRLLVRDADSRTVLIHPDPAQLSASPYTAIGFSLQPSTLYGMAREWLNRPNIDADWRVKRLIEDKGDDKGDEQHITYDWHEIHDHKLIATSQIIVVHPAVAGYLPDEGFLPDTGSTAFISSLPEKNLYAGSWERSKYVLESYEDHIRLVIEGFKELALPELHYAAPALERAAGWQSGSLMRAAWLACLLHDVGKLSIGWQNWAHAYQAQIGQRVTMGFAAAHTTFDNKDKSHVAAQKAIQGKYPKPPHAGEGALSCFAMVSAALDKNTDLIRATVTAITRHHTPFASECKPFILCADAHDHIRQTLKFVPPEVAQRVDLSKLWMREQGLDHFSNQLILPNNDNGWMAYALLARALRRADQRGTEKGAK